VIAHARQYEDKTILVAVPRFACTLMHGDVALPLGNAWKDWSLSLPSELQGTYRNIFTGAVLSADAAMPLAQVFASFPVAVFVTAS
jgi:(1->4)-alpha-D-glucan 1-alpha-D-glucosylmutase